MFITIARSIILPKELDDTIVVLYIDRAMYRYATYSRGQKKVPVPFPYNARSTFIRFKKNVVKTLNERACAVRTLTFF